MNDDCLMRDHCALSKCLLEVPVDDEIIVKISQKGWEDLRPGDILVGYDGSYVIVDVDLKHKSLEIDRRLNIYKGDKYPQLDHEFSESGLINAAGFFKVISIQEDSGND